MWFRGRGPREGSLPHGRQGIRGEGRRRPAVQIQRLTGGQPCPVKRLTAGADVVSKGARRARLIWLKSIGVARAISKKNRNTKGTIMRLMNLRPGALRPVI